MLHTTLDRTTLQSHPLHLHLLGGGVPGGFTHDTGAVEAVEGQPLLLLLPLLLREAPGSGGRVELRYCTDGGIKEFIKYGKRAKSTELVTRQF